MEAVDKCIDTSINLPWQNFQFDAGLKNPGFSKKPNLVGFIGFLWGFFYVNGDTIPTTS